MGGGGGSSSSSSNTTTNNTDARVVAGDGAIAVSNNGGGTVHVQTIDAGAVNSAFTFANQIAAGASASVAESLRVNADIAAGASKTVNQAFGEVAAAWADAKSGENKVLVGVGMAVVAVVALSAVKK